MTSTITTGQIRPDKTHVWSYPLWDGIHDEGLDLEAIQPGRSHDPNDRDRGPQPPNLRGDRCPGGGYQLLYDAPKN
jgi:hypothetical protein